MGNEQSSETPRGHRKLSKPPHCSQASAAGLPYTATAVTPHREHFSNSYLVGSLPPAPNKASSTRRVAPGLGIAVPAGDASSPIQSPTCRDPRRDLKSRTRSIQSEQSPILPAFVESSRASSMAQDSGNRTLARAESMPVAVRRGSTSYDTRATEAKKLLNAKEKLPSEPIISKTSNHSDETNQDVTDDTNNVNQSAGPSISRTNSDVSLYMPMRRSVVQTPGVATRAHHSNPPVSAKSSFRKSLPATPSQSRHNSIESGMARRMSMPTTIPSQAQSPDRAVTPVEADYKQLGGMKFGSLRITNGAPGTSPMPEDDVKQQGASESALAIPRAEYFDEQAKNPLSLMNQGSTMTGANELMTGEKSLTARVARCVAQCSSDAEKSRTGDGGMSGNGNAVSFPVAEVLDVREDPNAKPDTKKMQLGLENKMLKGLSRPDSGFIPSPSSEKTHRSASRVDSGYSSNVSLRSLPSLRSGVTDKNTMASEKLDVDMSGMCSPSDSNSTRTSSLVPSQTCNRLPIHLEVPLSSTDDDTSSTCPTNPSSPASRPFSPFARGSRMRLSSLKSNRSFEPRVSNTTTAPIVLSKGDFQEQLPSPTADVSRGGSKIYRFLNSSRKQGSLEKGEVTTVEQDATANPLGLKAGPVPKLHRPSLRKEPSKDTLHTIMSVGSQDAFGSTRRGKEQVARGVKKTAGKKMSRRQSWRQSIAQIFGSRSADASPALSSKPEPEPESTPRRPSPAMELTSRSFNAAPSPRAVRSWSSRPAPRKAASSSGNLASQARKTVNKLSIQESRDKPELAHLRTNVSAPNLSANRRLSLSPSALEMDQALRTKTSPPVSMQNRGSKPPRAKSQAQNRAMTPSFPINSRPSAGRRLSLPQDYGRMTPHSRQISHGRTESRNSSRGMAMSPTAGLSSQQVNAAQHSRVLSYSSNGTQQSGPAAQQVKHHRRVSAPAQPRQSSNMPRSRSSTTLIQIQQQQIHQQQMLQQHQQRRPRTSLQSWAPMDMHSLNQQLQQNYMMQNQALVYGTPNMVQQYPNIYVTSPVPNHPVHGIQGSQGGVYVQDPPFRVLHSYNSPAYRNVPIWSQ